jgi:hypothetical protein
MREREGVRGEDVRGKFSDFNCKNLTLGQKTFVF